MCIYKIIMEIRGWICIIVFIGSISLTVILTIREIYAPIGEPIDNGTNNWLPYPFS